MSHDNEAATGKLDSGRYVLLLCIGLVDGLGTGIVLPLLPFLLLHFGGAPALVTQLVALYSLSSFAANPVMGRLSDRVGRVRVLRLSLVGTVVSYVGMLLSWSLSGVFLFRILGGLLSGRAAIVPALITDGLARERHVQRLSWYAAATSFGLALGPVVGGLIGFAISDPVGKFRATLLCAASLAFLCLAGMMMVRHQPASSPAASIAGGGEKNSVWALVGLLKQPLALCFITSYAQGVVLSVTALFVHARFGWGVGHTGLLLGLLAVGVALARIVLLNRIVAWRGLEMSLLGCLAIVAPMMVVIALAPTPFVFVLAIGVFSVAGGLANLLPSAMVSTRAPAPARGAAMGLNSGVGALAMFISASSNGLWFQYVSPSAPYIVGAGAVCVGLLLLSARLFMAPRLGRASA